MFNPLGMRFAKAADEYDIARVTSDYERGAKLCVEAGFDSLEIHIGHNYLLSSFLSPKFNRRTDRWGGSIENRARFARQVVTAVRAAVGADVAVTAKLNMVDGYRGGLTIEDSLQVAPHARGRRRARRPRAHRRQLARQPDVPLQGGGAHRASSGRRCRGTCAAGSDWSATSSSAPTPTRRPTSSTRPCGSATRSTCRSILLGGISELATAERGLAAGFEFVAMARAILHHPDIVNEWARRHRHRLRLHPLQPVHADDLHRDTVPARRSPPRRPTHRDTPVGHRPSGVGDSLGGHRSDRVASSVLAARCRAVRRLALERVGESWRGRGRRGGGGR